VRNTLFSERLSVLHEALLDVIAYMNRPQGDQAIIDEAGIALDRALFALLVIVGRRGPIGIVDLADRVGRDYTTVSRQITKLETLGLVMRHMGKDRRVRAVRTTEAGDTVNRMIDAARERLAKRVLAAWTEEDLADLSRLMRRFADDIQGIPVAKPDAS